MYNEQDVLPIYQISTQERPCIDIIILLALIHINVNLKSLIQNIFLNLIYYYIHIYFIIFILIYS